MTENTKRISKYLKENWSWAAPTAYAYLTSVGLVYSWLRYTEFGINVLDFAEFNDFVLAAFRHPYVLFFSALMGVILYAYILLLDKSWGKLSDPDKLRSIARSGAKIDSYVLGLFLSLFIGRAKTKQRFLRRYRKILRSIPKRMEKISRTRWILHRFFFWSVIVIALVAPVPLALRVDDVVETQVDVHLLKYPAGTTSADFSELLFIGGAGKFVFFSSKSDKLVIIPISNLGVVLKQKSP